MTDETTRTPIKVTCEMVYCVFCGGGYNALYKQPRYGLHGTICWDCHNTHGHFFVIVLDQCEMVCFMTEDAAIAYAIAFCAEEAAVEVRDPGDEPPVFPDDVLIIEGKKRTIGPMPSTPWRLEP